MPITIELCYVEFELLRAAIDLATITPTSPSSGNKPPRD